MSSPGWFDDGSGRQRWWDGAQWLQYQDEPGTVLTAPQPKKAKGVAVGALIVGVVSFLIGWVPVLGIIVGAVAVILAVIGLVRKQPKGLAITGLILGAIAVVTSIIMTISLSTFVANRPQVDEPEVQTTAAPEEEPPSEEPVAEPEPEPEAAGPSADLASFENLDDRGFALIAKDPDANAGRNIIVYGSISQFDAATGKCAMRVSTAGTQKENSFEYDQNTIAVSGDGSSICPIFDPLVNDDHVKLWVTVDSSFDYDTQIGGSTTVPKVTVWQVELLPATEY